MNQRQHFAQFYETDLFLANSLADFVSAGISTGESVVVVATPDHRLQLEGQLLEKGVDLTGASSAGQYFALDAGKTLEELMIDGFPDRKLFDRTVSGLIEQAKRGGKSVRIFGEMVGLLWQRRNFEGAIRLEELWNGLHAKGEFLLFCAYPIIGLGAEPFSLPLTRICAEHHYTAVPCRPIVQERGWGQRSQSLCLCRLE